MSLEAIASALPSVREDAEDIARQCDADPTFVREKVGVATRYILGPDETGVDLAAAAATRLFERTELDPESIGLLVFVTQSPDRRIPHNAGVLAHALNLPKTCASFDVALGCSGFVYGLSIAEAFMAANEIDHALLVTCDPYSRIMAAEDKATNAVFGDAATASLLSRNGGRSRLRGLDFGTDGSGADAISIAAGGAARPVVALQQTEGLQTGTRAEHSLHMDGRAVFNFVNSTIPASVTASLDRAGLAIDDIDWFALHQGSLYMLQTLARRLRAPNEKLLINIDRYGNTVSSTIPLLLEELMANGHLDQGGKVLVSGFGVGLSWATGVLEFS